jgi:hypothetical protein
MAIRSDQSHLSAAGETQISRTKGLSRQKDKALRGSTQNSPRSLQPPLKPPILPFTPRKNHPRGPSPFPFPTKRGWFMGSTAAPLYVFSFISQLPHGRRGEREERVNEWRGEIERETILRLFCSINSNLTLCCQSISLSRNPARI